MIPTPAAPPPAAWSENASRDHEREHRRQLPRVDEDDHQPPGQIQPTFKGASSSAARPMRATPPMITSQVSTAMPSPEARAGGCANWLCSTTAMELGWVKGVVVRAATPATSA